MSIGSVLKGRKQITEQGGGGVLIGSNQASNQDQDGPVLRDPRIKLKPKESLHVLIQLRAMLSAGVPLFAALRTLRKHAATHQASKALERIATIIENGHDLSYAVDCLPSCFEKYVVHLLSAGERAGALDESLGRSIELLDKQIKLGSKIRGALAYPGFLLVMTAFMTIGILVMLVPKFESMLMSRPELLPSSTKMVLACSTFLRESPMFAVIGGISLLVGAIFAVKSKKIQGTLFDLVSHLPVIGTLIHKAYIARSVNTLALTLESGVPILSGLEHAAQVAELPRLRAHWQSAAAVVRGGRPMHSALEGAGLPPALVQMMVAGESSGSLDSSLRTASEFLDRETQAALEVFTGLLGPATVVLAGSIVGFIVVALMTPIMQMAKFVG